VRIVISIWYVNGLKFVKFTTTIPLSLYIHIPWCVKKCPYCDFNSHPVKDKVPEDRYIDALLKDLELDLPKVWGRRLISIFIGGGTPSLFSAKSLDRLLAGIRARLPFNPSIEITLEANPGTIERGQFQEYKAIGINRISVGVQSFNPKHLKILGRIHQADEAIRAVEELHAAGYETFNLDIMHGLPEQTVEEALADLSQAIALKPFHLSWYQLTLEPQTLFYAQPPTLPLDDTLAEIEKQGKDLLASAGLQQYEISAFCQPGHESLHNLNYWQFGDYLGIGAGAHGKITDMSLQTVTRYWKEKHPHTYLNQQFLAGEKIIDDSEMPFEFMMNILRLRSGFDAQLFTERTGLPLSTIESKLQQAYAKGLLERVGDVVRCTPRGALFLNDTISLFM